MPIFRRCLITFLSFCPLVRASTVTEYRHNLTTLISSEQAFAGLSRSSNTRNAFLHSFASDGMVFPGERVQAITYWTAQPQDSSWLDWNPIFADVALSGELGYTTGPYTNKSERTDSAEARHGYFFSVWKKEKGEWKVWLDMGVGGVPPSEVDTVSQFNRHEPMPSTTIVDSSAFSGAEAEFIAKQNTQGVAIFEKYLGAQCQVLRPRQRPGLDPSSAMKIISARGESIHYQLVETRVSTSGEFAVAYGTADIRYTDGSAVHEMNGHYVRVWKRYSGTWKIDVDVLIGFPKQ